MREARRMKEARGMREAGGSWGWLWGFLWGLAVTACQWGEDFQDSLVGPKDKPSSFMRVKGNDVEVAAVMESPDDIRVALEM